MTTAAVITGMITAAVTAGVPHAVVHTQPESQAALVTTTALAALLAAGLTLGRLRRRRTLGSLMLASALSVIALSGVFAAAIPALANLSAGHVVAWLAITTRLLGSLLFGLVAFVPDRPLRRPGRAETAAAAFVVGGMALIFIPWGSAGHLPAVVTAGSSRPMPHTTPIVLSVEMAAVVVSVVASAGYLRRSRRLGDEFPGWLAIAAVFAAAAHLNYFLSPALYAPVVSAGDVFLLCFCSVLAIGSTRELRSYWIAHSDARVASERRRLARDLHDGLAQELAYLSRNLEVLEGGMEEETLIRLRRAAERARLESRLAISGMTGMGKTFAGEALADAVGEVAKRFGLDLELDLLPRLRLPERHTDALVRVACEAVINAVRHSGVSLVAVSLHREGPQVRMVIRDRGRGFDPSANPTGFGLTSMRERAESVGAVFRVSSEPGCGSQVEVIL